MQAIPGDVIIEPASERSAPKSQPIQALAGLDPLLDDNAVREAINKAEANNQDPQTVRLDELAQVPGQTPVPETTAVQVEVPQKFLKPDGAVDVEKIAASTRQLNEAIAQKEEAVAKTVDDYMREYNGLETKFRNMPNPERLAANLPPPPQAMPPQQSVQDFEQIVRQDFNRDPLATTAQLIELAIEKRFEPLAAKEKIEQRRSNIQELANKDPRVLRKDIFDAINAKIQADPDIASRKNPHKAAWLEVKEELRLGEPSPVQTLPSRPLSPVLGGGTPPSAPSSSVQSSQTLNIDTLDLRDKKQEAMGDAAVRALLMGNRG